MLKRLFCKHEEIEFVENVYGDRINLISGNRTMRSKWRCKSCGKIIYKESLYIREEEMKTEVDLKCDNCEFSSDCNLIEVTSFSDKRQHFIPDAFTVCRKKVKNCTDYQ